MKKQWTALLFAAFMLVFGTASAQVLPSNDCFSPGLVRLTETLQEDPALRIEAEWTAEDAFYARDLSVLRTMLAGLTMRAESGVQEDGRTDALTLEREGEEIFSAAMTETEDRALLSVDGALLDVSSLMKAPKSPEEEALQNALSFLETVPILEKVPLPAVAQWLEDLAPGEVILPGLHAEGPFTLKRTMSDDGTRLTRIDLQGGLWIGGEIWQVSGFMRQPAGRAPKDTFEITIQKDEHNLLEFLYSALREREVIEKNRKGEVKVTTTLKLGGLLNGFRLSSRLNVTMQNDWTADGETLSEKILIDASLHHKDKTPGREYQRLHDLYAENRHKIRLTTQEGAPVTKLTDETEWHVTTEDLDFLGGGMNLTLEVGGEAPAALTGEAPQASPEDVQAAFKKAVETTSGRLYRQMKPETKEKIADGL